MTVDDREQRLPKWAREELMRLRQNLAHAERQRREVEDGTSPYFQERYRDGDFRRRYLVNEPIRVAVGDDELTITKDARHRLIRLQTNGMNLAVYPSSANTVEVEIVPSRDYLERLHEQKGTNKHA